MKKDNFYKIIIILLLVLNFGILGFMFLHKRPPGHGEPPQGPDRLIMERLRLDEKQKDLFEDLKKEHHGQMMAIEENTAKSHEKLFRLLQHDPLDTISRNLLIQEIGYANTQKDMVTFEHFRKLRAILHPDQVQAFDALVAELSMHLLHQGPPDNRR